MREAAHARHTGYEQHQLFDHIPRGSLIAVNPIQHADGWNHDGLEKYCDSPLPNTLFLTKIPLKWLNECSNLAFRRLLSKLEGALTDTIWTSDSHGNMLKMPIFRDSEMRAARDSLLMSDDLRGGGARKRYLVTKKFSMVGDDGLEVVIRGDHINAVSHPIDARAQLALVSLARGSDARVGDILGMYPYVFDVIVEHLAKDGELLSHASLFGMLQHVVRDSIKSNTLGESAETASRAVEHFLKFYPEADAFTSKSVLSKFKNLFFEGNSSGMDHACSQAFNLIKSIAGLTLLHDLGSYEADMKGLALLHAIIFAGVSRYISGLELRTEEGRERAALLGSALLTGLSKAASFIPHGIGEVAAKGIDLGRDLVVKKIKDAMSRPNPRAEFVKCMRKSLLNDLYANESSLLASARVPNSDHVARDAESLLRQRQGRYFLDTLSNYLDALSRDNVFAGELTAGQAGALPPLR